MATNFVRSLFKKKQKGETKIKAHYVTDSNESSAVTDSGKNECDV